MFKNEKDNMREFPTPERVFALGRLVTKRTYTRADLYRDLCISDVFGEGNQDIFGSTLAVAHELELIASKDTKLIMACDKAILEDYKSFRKYAACIAFSRPKGTFFKTTSLYLELAEKVLEAPGWSYVVSLFNDKGGLNLTDNDMLGWRFWTSFLGINYLHRDMLIPNIFTRVKDVLETQDDFKVGQSVPIKHFMGWLEMKCPETKNSRKEFQLSLGVSNGLRVLKEHDYIDLLSQPDAEKWQLSYLEAENINDVSHVQIKR
jgi:hypothetical protein